MIVIGNYKGKLSHDVKLPVPAGVIGDEYCTHWHINLTDTSKCRQVYNAIIKTCFDNCSWKIEVWAHGERLDNNNNTQQKKISKRRGILSYLSFRRKKKPQDQNPASSRFHSTKSTPWADKKNGIRGYCCFGIKEQMSMSNCWYTNRCWSQILLCMTVI